MPHAGVPCGPKTPLFRPASNRLFDDRNVLDAVQLQVSPQPGKNFGSGLKRENVTILAYQFRKKERIQAEIRTDVVNHVTGADVVRNDRLHSALHGSKPVTVGTIALNE